MLVTTIRKIVGFCTHFPWLVIGVFLAGTAVSAYYAATHFEITTDINTLISPNLDWRQREATFEAEQDKIGDITLATVLGVLGLEECVARMTSRARILSRHTKRASTARAMAASLMRRDAAMPSPRRMMREKASTTRKPSLVGRATRSRQLLVPRSSAA